MSECVKLNNTLTHIYAIYSFLLRFYYNFIFHVLAEETMI